MGKKEETHERIVRTAAQAIRKHGYDGVSVADIMKDAGLTHGGFYAHFDSREALVVEALEAAVAQSTAHLAGAMAAAPPGEALGALADAYLDDAHARKPELGCCMAALGSETPRQPAEVRAVLTRHVEDMVARVARGLPADVHGREREAQAMALLSTLVGALLISRAVDDRALGAALRAAARDHVRDQAGTP
jgi:TetR/AcrR family transcriptional repressor of nem operon